MNGKSRMPGIMHRAVLLGMMVVLPLAARGQAHPHRGLWVGTVALHAVNEVSIPLDAGNVQRAQDPRVPTPSFDRAELRLLLHVNGAGQVSLLKDVAILNRNDPASADALAQAGARETDLALVTDPRMYAEFPPQPAMRLASAAFDFGDAKATEALDVIVEEAARIAAAFATDAGLAVETQAERLQARDDAVTLIEPVLEGIVAKADVASAFSTYIGSFPALADSIAAGTANIPALQADAAAVRDQSFYTDTRALDLVNAVVAAVDSAAPGAEVQAARHVASSYADVGNEYHRFVSGQVFGDMLVAAAAEAGGVAGGAGSLAVVRDALVTTPEAMAAVTRALQIKVQAFNDSRGEDAIDTVLDAMAAAAFSNAALSAMEISRISEEAGRAVLAAVVGRYPLPVTAPTLDYNGFVASATFLDSPSQAAMAAATAAIDARATNPLYTELSVYSAAKIAALNALRAPYGLAARSMRSELPLAGSLAPGQGDPRMLADLAQPTDLGPAGLEGRIYLPAGAPTNPFRHRRHPDHGLGFNIERLIRLDFDGVTGDALEPAGYGVDRIAGTYREEIFGLHKPLGPEPETAPIGLRTEGRFELNRISLIDTLNTR